MDFNILQGGRFEAVAVPGFVTVPHSVTANTKGAYVTLVAATSFVWRAMQLFIQNDINASRNQALVDIAVGAAGSEVVIFPNLLLSTILAGGSPVYNALQAVIPCDIPAGSRIAVRGQNPTGGVLNSYVSVTGFGTGFPGPQPASRAQTLGAVTTTTRGVELASSTTNDVKGSWAEISSSLPFNVRFLVPIAAFEDTLANYCIDFGIGGAGSEVVIFPDLLHSVYAYREHAWPLAIPAGQRLAARCSCSGAAGSSRKIDVAPLILG